LKQMVSALSRNQRPKRNVSRALLEGIGHTTGTLSAAVIRFYRGLKGVLLITGIQYPPPVRGLRLTVSPLTAF